VTARAKGRAQRRRPAADDGPRLVIGDGSAATGDREVVVHAIIADPDGADRAYELVEAGAFSGAWTAWTGEATMETRLTLSDGDGVKELGLRYRSSTTTLELAARVILDTSPPAVSVVAEDGAGQTPDRTVRLDVTADDLTAPRSMTISTDGGRTWADPRPFDARQLIDLPPGTRSGPVDIRVRVRDAAGNAGEGGDTVRFQPRRSSTMDLRIEYALDVDLSYRDGRIEVDEAVSVENRTGRLITDLDLYLMPRAFGELRSGPTVWVDGAKTSGRWTNNANLRIRLPAPLAHGEHATLRLRFGLRASAVVRSSLEARLARAHGMMTVGHWFATVSAGYPARYPGDALVSPVAERIVVDLRHDRGLVVAAPGQLTASSATSKRYVLAPARDFAFAVSPSYRRAVGDAAGVRVEAYARSSGGARAMLESARRGVAVFSGALGAYPWSRLVLAESPWPAHGTEYSGFLMIGALNLHDRLLVTHEVAHEWFQAMVGNDQFADPWVDEGLAEFLSRLWFGRQTGYCSSRPVDTSIFAYPNIQMPLVAAQCGSYFQTAYLKGQALYFGLRARMGQSALLGALRAVVVQHRWDLLDTAELRGVLLDHGAPRRYLDGFLGGW
jgi:hypothetical protein